MEEEFLLAERANIRFASIVARIFSPSLSLSLSIKVSSKSRLIKIGEVSNAPI